MISVIWITTLISVLGSIELLARAAAADESIATISATR